MEHTTKMRAEVVYLTPEKAAELLKMNVGNRKVKACKRAYEGQMLAGEWKENGEPIIIDTNGFIKDGQHRLIAMIDANFSYHCVIVYDVDGDVMDTIDTGTNRSLHDVLQLNGIVFPNETAATCKLIMRSDRGLSVHSIFRGSGSDKVSKRGYLSNNKCLAFCRENAEGLALLVSSAAKIHDASTIKVLTKSETAYFLFLLGGWEIDKNHLNYLRRITGLTIENGTTSQKINKALVTAKVNKESLDRGWKLAVIVNGWNVFCEGDHKINSINVDPDKTQTIKVYTAFAESVE